MDLHEDIENGIPNSLHVALAILIRAKDAFLWNSNFLISGDWQSLDRHNALHLGDKPPIRNVFYIS